MANIEQITANFNKLREDHQGMSFNQVDMRALLSLGNIPYSSRIGFLVEFGAIINPVRGQYVFPTLPVHISVIRKYYEKALAASRKPTTEDENRMAIEEAIQVLKDSGKYQIFKKVIKWEEVK